MSKHAPTPWNIEKSLTDPALWHLWDELKHATILNRRGGSPRDFIGPVEWTLLDGASWLPTGGIICDATNDGAEAVVPVVLRGRGWPITLAWYGFSVGTPAANNPMFNIKFDTGGASPFEVASISLEAGGTTVRMSGNVGGSFQHSSTASGLTFSTLVQPSTLIGVFESDASWKLYHDGLLIMDHNPTGTGDPSWGTLPLYVYNNSAVQTRDPNIVTLGSFMWYRTLSASEAKTFAKDPFGPFRHFYDNRTIRAHGFGGVVEAFLSRLGLLGVG